MFLKLNRIRILAMFYYFISFCSSEVWSAEYIKNQHQRFPSRSEIKIEPSNKPSIEYSMETRDEVFDITEDDAYITEVEPIISRLEKMFPTLNRRLRYGLKDKMWAWQKAPILQKDCLFPSVVKEGRKILSCQNSKKILLSESLLHSSSEKTSLSMVIMHQLLAYNAMNGLRSQTNGEPTLSQPSDRNKVIEDLEYVNEFFFYSFNDYFSARDIKSQLSNRSMNLFTRSDWHWMSHEELKIYRSVIRKTYRRICVDRIPYVSIVDSNAEFSVSPYEALNRDFPRLKSLEVVRALGQVKKEVTANLNIMNDLYAVGIRNGNSESMAAAIINKRIRFGVSFDRLCKLYFQEGELPFVSLN